MFPTIRGSYSLPYDYSGFIIKSFAEVVAHTENTPNVLENTSTNTIKDMTKLAKKKDRQKKQHKPELYVYSAQLVNLGILPIPHSPEVGIVIRDLINQCIREFIETPAKKPFHGIKVNDDKGIMTPLGFSDIFVTIEDMDTKPHIYVYQQSMLGTLTDIYRAQIQSIRITKVNQNTEFGAPGNEVRMYHATHHALGKYSCWDYWQYHKQKQTLHNIDLAKKTYRNKLFIKTALCLPLDQPIKRNVTHTFKIHTPNSITATLAAEHTSDVLEFETSDHFAAKVPLIETKLYPRELKLTNIEYLWYTVHSILGGK